MYLLDCSILGRIGFASTELSGHCSITHAAGVLACVQERHRGYEMDA